jgi:Big-like domain-containing protein/PKD domain-containing protein
MVAQARRSPAWIGPLVATALLLLVSACDKVPLLAPTGSVISLFPAANNVPINGTVEIVVTVIENGVAATTTPGTGTGGTGTTGGGTTTPGGTTTTPAATTTTTTRAGAGTPVQNGTLVSFTTTMGTIEPREARTQNGEVRVKFNALGQSGLATITAYSGGASGKLENLKIGSAAAERVLVSATPQTLGPAGGSSIVSARVEDASGAGVAGVPVTFTSDAGSLSASSATTDANGVATVTLNTSRAAKVTANVAGKTADVTVGLNPRTGITLTGPTTPVSAGVPATFTVAVGSTANVRDVTVDFGDGTRRSLGALSVSTTINHTYTEPGTYAVTATALEASGFTEQVSTDISVLPGQPPAVTITASNNNPSVGETVILTADVSGATSTVVSYEWNFGADAVPATAVTTGNRATVSYIATGTKVVTVRVNQGSGPSGEGTTAIVVKP